MLRQPHSNLAPGALISELHDPAETVNRGEGGLQEGGDACGIYNACWAFWTGGGGEGWQISECFGEVGWAEGLTVDGVRCSDFASEGEAGGEDVDGDYDFDADCLCCLHEVSTKDEPCGSGLTRGHTITALKPTPPRPNTAILS